MRIIAEDMATNAECLENYQTDKDTDNMPVRIKRRRIKHNL